MVIANTYARAYYIPGTDWNVLQVRHWLKCVICINPFNLHNNAEVNTSTIIFILYWDAELIWSISKWLVCEKMIVFLESRKYSMTTTRVLTSDSCSLQIILQISGRLTFSKHDLQLLTLRLKDPLTSGMSKFLCLAFKVLFNAPFTYAALSSITLGKTDNLSDSSTTN